MSFPRDVRIGGVMPMSPLDHEQEKKKLKELFEALTEAQETQKAKKGKPKKEQAAVASLMCEFEWNGKNLRLIHTGMSSDGQVNEFLIERQEQDAMGDPRWVQHARLSDKYDNNSHALLLDLIGQLLLKDPLMEAAHRTGGWPAVSAINVERKKKA